MTHGITITDLSDRLGIRRWTAYALIRRLNVQPSRKIGPTCEYDADLIAERLRERIRATNIQHPQDAIR